MTETVDSNRAALMAAKRTFFQDFYGWLASKGKEGLVLKQHRPSNMWISVPGTPFVISVFHSGGYVGIFVRPQAVVAEPGHDEAQLILDRLTPDARRLLLPDTKPYREFQLIKRRSWDPADRMRWPVIFDWLEGLVDQYGDVLARLTARVARDAEAMEHAPPPQP